MAPKTVHLENITYIDAIPYRNFVQIEKLYYSADCSGPISDFKSLMMIGEIQSGAIVAVSDFENATLINVKVERLQTSGVKLKMNEVHAGELTFENNDFNELSLGPINCTADQIDFVNNVVQLAQPYSFSLLATEVFILNNVFHRLKSGA
ncbi:hypothetical protein GWI33_000754 [Rhynchophorus ferrugineus]|uniref:Uncharacterized protein n=1 Tax=Rhynchophorus ferrugineus TaxID=354439 RepID=A0A834HM08_RHYFE|nr:hypothetical protein GWI33_000754 [Rhynchophorus ferrugineus]